MIVSIEDSNSQNIYKKCFYPDDINDMQTFKLNDNAEMLDGKSLENVKKLSILFEKSSDFFGRIIIYHFELLAWETLYTGHFFLTLNLIKFLPNNVQ